MTTATNRSKVNVLLSPALAIALIMSTATIAALDSHQKAARNRPLLVAMEDEGKMGGAGGQMGGGMGAPSPAAQASPGATAPAPMHPENREMQEMMARHRREMREMMRQHMREMDEMMRKHRGGPAGATPGAASPPAGHGTGSMRHGKGMTSGGMGGMGGQGTSPSPASSPTPHSGGMMKDM